MPIFQVLLLITYLKMADRIRTYFATVPAARSSVPGGIPATPSPQPLGTADRTDQPTPSTRPATGLATAQPTQEERP
jgi:hypothetical protein